MNNQWEVIVVGSGVGGMVTPAALSRPAKAQRMDLKERFTDKAEAIDKWFDAIIDGRDAIGTVRQVRSMASVVASALKWWRGKTLSRFCERTTAEVVNEPGRTSLAPAFRKRCGAAFCAPGASTPMFLCR